MDIVAIAKRHDCQQYIGQERKAKGKNSLDNPTALERKANK